MEDGSKVLLPLLRVTLSQPLLVWDPFGAHVQIGVGPAVPRESNSSLVVTSLEAA